MTESKVRICFENSEGKEELMNYLINTLGQNEVAYYLKIIKNPAEAEFVVDVADLETKDQVADSVPFILEQLWIIKYNLELDKPVQSGQKKHRLKNNR